MKLPQLSLFKPLIGIDLGHRTIKGVILKKKGRKVVLDRYFFADLAEVLPGFPKSRDPSKVLLAMQEILKLAGVRASTAIPDDQVFNFEISLPQMPKSEVGQAIQFEAANQARISETELAVDFWEEAGKGGEKGGMVRYRAFAARTEQLAEAADRIRGAGFKPESIESVMLANIESLRHAGYIGDKSQCAVIDLGDSETVTAFVRDGVLHYCRSEKTGSGALNESLCNRMGISFDESDRKKLEYRFNEEGGDPVAREALESAYLRIFKAIKDSIEGYLENSPGARLESILLVGGGSSAAGIADVIGGFFGIPALVANPFKNIEIYGGRVPPTDGRVARLASQLTTAIGLALRGVE